MRTLIITLFAFTTLLGCARGGTGHFGDHAYYTPRSHYRIRYPEGQTHLLSADWTVANFRAEEQGQPFVRRQFAARSGRLSSFALPGASMSLISLPIDLVLAEGSDSEIWVRTVVLPPAWRTVPTWALLNSWAQALASRSSSLAPTGAPPPVVIRAQGNARVDGRAARWLELDIHRNGGEQRITLVALRTERGWRIRRRQSAPILLVFGLLSSAEHHENARQDFQRLISRVDLQR